MINEMKASSGLALIFVSLIFGACNFLGGSRSKEKTKDLPRSVKVQSILIAFKGSLPGKEIERSKEEAQKLAQDVFEKSKKQGEDFGSLVVSYSDDMIPGVFDLTNDAENKKTDQFLKSEFFTAWADKAFELEVGELAYIPYEENQAAYGFYILKRLE